MIPKHTWEKEESKKVPLGDIPIKTLESDTWGIATVEDILSLFRQQRYSAKHVGDNGREPCLYDLRRFDGRLRKSRF